MPLKGLKTAQHEAPKTECQKTLFILICYCHPIFLKSSLKPGKDLNKNHMQENSGRWKDCRSGKCYRCSLGWWDTCRRENRGKNTRAIKFPWAQYSKI